MENMFCYQCQEAIGNKGCTKFGACGKTPTVAHNFDSLKYLVKSLAKAVNKNDVSDDLVKKCDIFIMNSLFKCITNANFDDVDLANVVEKGSVLYQNVTGEKVDFSELSERGNALYTKDEDIRAARETILYGLMGMAAYHAHANNLNKTSKEVFDFTREALAALLDDSIDLMGYVSYIDRTGEFGVAAMATLDEANTSAFGNPEISKVSIGVKAKPGILISGHDLHDIKELLEQSKNSGIDIYTHSEMLPAHYYPELKKYNHLVGNYGGAWYAQKTEFETFNGPILFTTNCLVPPAKNCGYNDRVYMTGNTGMPNWKRIEVGADGKKDFSKIIAHAKKCAPPTEIETGEIVGGFAHNQVIALADTVVGAVKSGAIKKFVVMAGCDGRNKSREYYTDFAENLPEDTVILTAGCAKYRYNKLNLGDIGGIPRVLDAGQCNDSYSLVVIALKLAEVFECGVNDLPIAYNIAWYEQKAVIVLLALLHLGVKNIHVGPTLPAFLSENVANFLIDTYGLSTISNVEDDIKTMI
jgi:hydroxylamine reductase